MDHVDTSQNRPPIPAELRRMVLTESGHRCAIPTCRATEIDIHHIEPWEDCKEHDFANLIALCPNCHRRAHKGEIDRKSLRLYKNQLRSVFDHGTVKSGTIVLDRSNGQLHLLTVAGNITITTTGWIPPIDTIVLKISNAGSHTITWNGFTSLPFSSGFTFTANGTDIIELNYYDGEVHFKAIRPQWESGVTHQKD